MPDQNQRGFYRVEYPRPARPVLEMQGGELEILDCSESGLRFALTPDMLPPEPGTEISGTLRLNENRQVEVVGKVTRLYGKSVAMRFEGDGVPFGLILAEQKYLRMRFRH